MGRTLVRDTTGRLSDADRTDTPSLYRGVLSGVRSMSEADLLKGVLDIARVLGWKTLHLRPARTAHGYRTPIQGDGVGWPDVFLVRRTRLVAAELKAERGRMTDAQRDWLEALRDAGVETFEWRPADYPDRVAEVLR